MPRNHDLRVPTIQISIAVNQGPVPVEIVDTEPYLVQLAPFDVQLREKF